MDDLPDWDGMGTRDAADEIWLGVAMCRKLLRSCLIYLPVPLLRLEEDSRLEIVCFEACLERQAAEAPSPCLPGAVSVNNHLRIG